MIIDEEKNVISRIINEDSNAFEELVLVNQRNVYHCIQKERIERNIITRSRCPILL